MEFDDEIVLDEEALGIFNCCCKLKSKYVFKLWLAEYDNRYNPTYFAKPPRESDTRFVM